MSNVLSLEPARRVAVVHYTGPPAVGGIEGLMARQSTVLAKFGHQAVYVVGRGSISHGAETIEIPLMDPSNVDIAGGVRALEGVPPAPHHPFVEHLVARLGAVLKGCTDCWIHNVLTVSLNPFLTVALEVLMERQPDIRWVGWTADISSASHFVPAKAQRTIARAPVVIDRVTWIAISQTRRLELSTWLGIDAECIRVVNPPLDVSTWLDFGSQARTVISATDLLAAEPVVLVPAKALPHKGLERAVRVGAALARPGRTVRMLVTAATSPHEPDTSARVRRVLRRTIDEALVGSTVTLLPDLLGADAADQTVRELMQVSDVVFLPSIEEGFGMPLLEAAACRVPVVCTDIPVFREVAADSAMYFDASWGDEQVASVVLSAAEAGYSPLRRTALRAMRRFEADIEVILDNKGHPNV